MLRALCWRGDSRFGQIRSGENALARSWQPMLTVTGHYTWEAGLAYRSSDLGGRRSAKPLREAMVRMTGTAPCNGHGDRAEHLGNTNGKVPVQLIAHSVGPCRSGFTVQV
jgi:hypothetical protein